MRWVNSSPLFLGGVRFPSPMKQGRSREKSFLITTQTQTAEDIQVFKMNEETKIVLGVIDEKCEEADRAMTQFASGKYTESLFLRKKICYEIKHEIYKRLGLNKNPTDRHNLR